MRPEGHCHGCKKREPGCHCKCDDYKEYKQKLAEWNENREKQLEPDYYFMHEKRKCLDREIKKRMRGPKKRGYSDS